MNLNQMTFTRLIDEASSGNSEAYKQAFQSIYQELKATAKALMAKEPSGHTLQPTALVHELFLKMSKSSPQKFASKKDFINIAAYVMRQILVSYARKKKAQKRPGNSCRNYATLDRQANLEPMSPEDLLVVNETLDYLEEKQPRQAKVLTLKLFGGLTFAEISEIIGISETHTRNEFKKARAWLLFRLKGTINDSQ